ncbi:MAG: hypothetical protein ACK4GQ_05250, partial [Candidatus Hadarchaeales archaeon]
MWRSGAPGPWAQRSFRIDTLPPGKPTLLSPADGENENDSTPNLQWSAPPENSYPLTFFVQISTSQYFDNIVTSAWVNEENWEVPPVLQENVWYWWKVLVGDNAGNTGDFSSPRKFKIDTVAPVAPTVQWPENNGWTTPMPNLDWVPVPENSLPVVYFGEISLFPDFSGTPLRTITTTDDNWSVSPALSEGTYYWRLKARDNAGNSGAWSKGYIFKVDNTPPTAPQPTTPPNNGSAPAGIILFEWTAASDGGSGVGKYIIQIDDESGFNLPLVHENDNVTGTTYSYLLEFPKTYYWRVKAVDNVGNQGEWSETFNFLATTIWRFVEGWSATVTATVWYRLAESWNATITTTAWYRLAESWNATITTTAWYRLAESWTAAVTANPYLGWFIAESRSATVAANPYLGWFFVEGWQAMITTFAGWSQVESWLTTITTTAQWQIVESWTATITTTTIWQQVEVWTATVVTTAEWRLVETWQGVTTTIAKWLLTESWSGTLISVSGWQAIENWWGDVTTGVYYGWIYTESWSGYASSGGDWTSAEFWNATIEGQAIWKIVESWSTMITTCASWKVAETWQVKISGPIPAPILIFPPDGYN